MDALENIICACNKQLNLRFPKGIPAEIERRYAMEISYLRRSDCIEDFEIFRCLSALTDNRDNFLMLKGTASGSIIYFLVTEHGYNPLPPYYYCAECGYYEPIHKWGNCVDAPNVSCPKCGQAIQADGYNVSIESMWGLDGTKAIGFEKEDAIHPVVEKRLNQLIKKFELQSFEDKINLCACASSIYSWEKNGDEELDLDRFNSFIFSEEFKACKFFTREELYENLCAKGIKPKNAYRMSEFVRKGGVVRRTKEVHKYEIPEEIVSVAQSICYLESRAHAIQTAYRYWIRDNN